MALQTSQAPPGGGYRTVGEVECHFLTQSCGEDMDFVAASGLQCVADMYVDTVTSLTDHPEDHTHHFLPVSEHWLKKAISTWRDVGLLPALEGVATDPELRDSSVGVIASWITGLQRWGEGRLSQMVLRHSLINTAELVREFSPVSDWVRAPVKAMDLHPRLPYIAIARQDDTIEIRSLSQMEPSIILRDRDQDMVTCLQWAPHSNSLLAVGAKGGVLLWNVDPSLQTSRFLTSWVRVERSPCHVPVSSVCWSPRANFIVSGSAADTNLMVWDVPLGVATRVRRTEGGGVHLVCVAPSGARVFAASVGNVMRVWETEKWTCEKWTNSTGRCKAACWSPKGDFLLFALDGDHALYYLGFHGNNTAGSVTAIKCADLSPCIPSADGQEDTVVGGSVQSMCWDSTGQRLALLFTAESPGHSLVAVFRTRISSMLEILPGGFIRGDDGDLPQLITFQQNCKIGALLATAWLSGRVSFTPFLFTSSLLPSLTHHNPHLNHSHLYSTQHI